MQVQTFMLNPVQTRIDRLVGDNLDAVITHKPIYLLVAHLLRFT